MVVKGSLASNIKPQTRLQGLQDKSGNVYGCCQFPPSEFRFCTLKKKCLSLQNLWAQIDLNECTTWLFYYSIICINIGINLKKEKQKTKYLKYDYPAICVTLPTTTAKKIITTTNNNNIITKKKEKRKGKKRKKKEKSIIPFHSLHIDMQDSIPNFRAHGKGNIMYLLLAQLTFVCFFVSLFLSFFLCFFLSFFLIFFVYSRMCPEIHDENAKFTDRFVLYMVPSRSRKCNK